MQTASPVVNVVIVVAQEVNSTFMGMQIRNIQCRFRSNNSEDPYFMECGFYLALGPVLALALLSLLALLLCTGVVVTNKTRIGNAANVAALAGLETFVQTGNTVPTCATEDLNCCPGNIPELQCRKAKTILKVNQILAQNPLPLFEHPHGGVTLTEGETNSGGHIVFGTYYHEDPDGPTNGTSGTLNPCNGSYPCFRSEANQTQNINALRLFIRTQPDNYLDVPFGNLLGSIVSDIETSATAAVAQRCSVFAIDGSTSVVKETHKSNYPSLPNLTLPGNGADPYFQITMPTNSAYFAYHEDYVNPDSNPDAVHCEDVNTYDATDRSYEDVYWCNMPRGIRPDNANSPTQHYTGDYRTFTTPYGLLKVDTRFAPSANPPYTGPKPLSTYMQAINVALKQVELASSPGDRISFIYFRGDIDPKLGHVPPLPTPLPDGQIPITLDRLTNEVSWLIRLTNLNNAFSPNPQLPTFITQGMIPMQAKNSDPLSASTNILGALTLGLNDLAACPDTSRKSFIMATDGIPTCTDNSADGAPNGCTGHYSVVTKYFSKLFSGGNPVIKQFKDRKIAFTVISDGDYIRPGFMNRKNPEYYDLPGIDSDDPRRFVSPKDALKYNMDASPNSTGKPLGMFWSDDTIPPPNQCQRPNEPMYSWCNTNLGCQSGCLPGACVNGDQCSCFTNSQCSCEGSPTDFPMCDDACMDCCQPSSSNSNVGLCNSATWSKKKFGYRYAGIIPGVTYSEGIAALNKMAARTGGIPCPLLPICPGGIYDYVDNPINPGGPKVLNAGKRGLNQLQGCAVEYLTKAEQAAQCVKETVNGNPYMVVSSSY